MMESKDIISSICFKLKNENIQIVSFNGQCITFCLSIKEIYYMDTYNYMCIYTLEYLQLYEYLYKLINIFFVFVQL